MEEIDKINPEGILKVIPQILFVLNEDREVTYANKFAEEFVNKSKGGVLGRDLFFLLPALTHTNFEDKLRAAEKYKKRIEFEVNFIEEFKWYKVYIQNFEKKFIVIFESIDKNKEIEEELSQHKDQMLLSQEVGRMGSFVWSIQTGKLVSVGLKRLYDIENGVWENTFKNWLRNVDILDRKWVEKRMFDIVDGGGEISIEFRIRCPDKKINWMALKGRVVYDQNKKPIKMIGIQTDITDRKHTEDYLYYLSEASKVLSSSLDYKTTLKAVVDLAVPHIADWCIVDMLSDDGKEIELLAVSHSDYSKVKWARKLRKQNPPSLEEPNGVAKVIRTGSVEYYPNISPEVVDKSSRNEAQAKILKDLGICSVIILPLRSQDKIVGAITMVSSDSGYQYNESDLYLARQLAERASLAIENSRLYSNLQNAKDRLNNIISNVPGVVWEAFGEPDSENQRIDFVSEYVYKMLGYSDDEWLSTPNFWLKIVHPDDKKAAVKNASLRYKKGESGSNVFRWMKKNGESIWVESHSSVIRSKTGKKIGMRGVVMDVTERTEAERRKDDFISMASHELKTPLTSLGMYAQLLNRKVKAKNYKSAMKISYSMEKQIERLSNLVRELLDLSRLNSGKLYYHFEKVNLEELVKQVTEEMLLYQLGRDIRISGTIKGTVKGDRDRLGQVLTNLLSNAFKYSTDGKPIDVYLSSNSKEISFTVQDYGIGIPRKYQRKIFERFYQVDEPVEKTYPGLGIGLYITSEIIEHHGGKIKLESQKGKGAAFTVSLPKS